jgi:hypothetical protein
MEVARTAAASVTERTITRQIVDPFAGLHEVPSPALAALHPSQRLCNASRMKFG